MESTNCLPYMMREMKALTNGHAVAELCVIYCFAYMVEGASGFGTPVALGAPMLISLGHPKLESVIVLLLANTFATVFGAAGTPIGLVSARWVYPNKTFYKLASMLRLVLPWRHICLCHLYLQSSSPSRESRKMCSLSFWR